MTDIVVSNAEFINAVMGPLVSGEYYWATAFAISPETARALEWAGSPRATVPDYPDQNAYISSAILKPVNTSRKKDRAHFGRLPLVVLDDAKVDNCSYSLETSAGNFQTGFILTEHIADEETAGRLQRALGKQGLVKADKNGYSSVRYVRLPVGTNTKHTPPWRCRLASWTPGVKFTLADLATTFGLDLEWILHGETHGADLGDLAPDITDFTTDDELVRDILSGDHLHGPIMQLSARYIGRGVPATAVVDLLQTLSRASNDAGSPRWQSRYNDIARTVNSAVEKFARKPDNWPELVDPFADYVAPPFPVDALPPVFAELCEQLAVGSGFDAGGYAFALLVASSSLIDHRARFSAGPLKVPAYLWGGLVARSGGGKSPIAQAALTGLRKIDSDLVRRSNEERAHWESMMEDAGAKGPKLPKPPWRQLVANDTTVEALGQLLQDNPAGVVLAHDELTEFIGRMDAYSSGGASGKDRGTYLRAFDGGPMTINRASKAPMVIDHFSVGILTGIQPEKLADLFKKSGGGSDGLYQRFLVYALKPAGLVDYSAAVQQEAIAAVHELQRRMRETAGDWDLFGDGFADAALCPEALPLMEQYHQHARNLAQRTQAQRLAEHTDKFPGFLARIIFTLHHLECADSGKVSGVVGVATFNKALRIMQCLHLHSTSVYEAIDAQCGEVGRLVKSACEAILSKQWEQVQHGDLTRDATGWRDADPRAKEQAIDRLIDFGWLQDTTLHQSGNKRGRRTQGTYVVNPTARHRFAQQADRIRMMRNERHEALTALGSQRNARAG